MSDTPVAVVVEDDPDARELTDLVLRQSGFEVVTAPDGPSGLAAIRQHSPVLTTLDVQMPGMDGYEVARQLRAFSLTYLVMITSRDAEADVIAGFQAGADDYLVKPFRPRELRARADSMMRRELSRPGVEPAAPGGTSWAAQLARELGTETTGPGPSPLLGSPTTGGPGLAPTVARGRLALPQNPPSAPQGTEAASGRDVTRWAGISVAHDTGVVTLDGSPVALTPAQFRLLATLVLTGHRVRSRADLAHCMRGDEHVPGQFVDEDDKLEADRCITALKATLGDLDEPPRYIEVIDGVGCRMARTDTP